MAFFNCFMASFIFNLIVLYKQKIKQYYLVFSSAFLAAGEPALGWRTARGRRRASLHEPLCGAALLRAPHTRLDK